jgi:hypothetical protein
MAAAYGGLDVRDPRLDLRRFSVLLDYLPPSGRVGGDAWSVEADLLAVVADRLAELTWVTMRAHGAKVARPKPLRRPPPARHRARQAPGHTTTPGPPPAAHRDAQGRAGWLAAAEQLAVIPGVVVEHDDG